MDIIQERAKDVVEKVIDFFKKFTKEVIEPVWEMFKKIFNSIDWDKYNRYLKYKKRVENRKRLYDKRKDKYGKF